MALICEDLANYGAVLIPPSADRYFELRADVERRLQVRPKGSPPVQPDALRPTSTDDDASAILLNQAQVAIASVAYYWSFQTGDGRILPHRFLPGTNPSALLPFCLDDPSRKFHAFWQTIFPGSKRLMTADGHWYGDNTDVRSPEEDEVWQGGFSGGRGEIRTRQIEPVKLTLDGVFFSDGGFAGPNQFGVWEQTTFAAEAYLVCAELAREARGRGTSPETFFVQIKEHTGYQDGAAPPPPPHPFGPPDLESIRKDEQWHVGSTVIWMRKRLGDEGAIARIAAWGDVPAARLHKL